MSRDVRLGVLVVVIGALLWLLSLLNAILLPFIAGLAVAYFLDPAADRLEAWRFPRWLAAAVIIAAFFVVIALVAVVLFPLVQAQVVELAGRVPELIAALGRQARPVVEGLQKSLTPEQVERLQGAAGAYAGDVLQWLARLLGDLVSGGVAFLNLLALAVVTPVVAFYMLRDWDRITARVSALLPRDMAPTIQTQLAEIDRTIAAFLRGQATVCLVLAAWYVIGLTVIGLKFGLLVGLIAGLLSFIPYVGAAVGFGLGLGIAFWQFAAWVPIALVAAVIVVGQVAESYLLGPKLVGEKVGLHPVWLMFALLAGGALFGFTGVLLAVPAAAVIGVLVRFWIARYLASPLYQGGGRSDGAP